MLRAPATLWPSGNRSVLICIEPGPAGILSPEAGAVGEPDTESGLDDAGIVEDDFRMVFGDELVSEHAHTLPGPLAASRVVGESRFPSDTRRAHGSSSIASQISWSRCEHLRLTSSLPQVYQRKSRRSTGRRRSTISSHGELAGTSRIPRSCHEHLRSISS